MRVVRRAWEASDKVVTLNRNIPRPCCMHRWLLTLQNMACSTFRGDALIILPLVFKIRETSWVGGLIWDFIDSLTLQSSYWIIHSVVLVMWTSPLNVPRTAAVSLVKVVTKAPELPQAAAVLQKTMQIWEVACSKIICKVRTLQAAVIACHNPVSYVLWGVIYIWISRDIASKMEWLEGRVLSRVLSKMRWIFGFDMTLRFIFAEESIQKQVEFKKGRFVMFE